MLPAINKSNSVFAKMYCVLYKVHILHSCVVGEFRIRI